jgi:hypothetical protein
LKAFGKHIGYATPLGLGRIKAALGYKDATPTELSGWLVLAAVIIITSLISPMGVLAEENSGQTDSEAVKAYKQFIESPPIIKSLKARIETRAVSFTFIPNDITNLEGFAARLGKPAASDQISQYLRTNLSGNTLVLLSNNFGTTSWKLQLRHALTDDLNRIIQSEPIFDPQRFAGVKFSVDMLEVLDKKPVGSRMVQLNRQMLLDAYPGEVSNEHHPATHETYLEIRYQPNAFYVKTATNLDGLSEPYLRPIWEKDRLAGAAVTDSLAAGWLGPIFGVWPMTCCKRTHYRKL